MGGFDGGRGAPEGRGIGVGIRGGAGAGDDGALGAALGDATAATGGELFGAGAGVDGALTAMFGTGAGAGISSPPHSASISSVGGALDGTIGRMLARSLSDRFSVIALCRPFHDRAHKSRAPNGLGRKDSISRSVGGAFHRRCMLSRGGAAIRRRRPTVAASGDRRACRSRPRPSASGGTPCAHDALLPRRSRGC